MSVSKSYQADCFTPKKSLTRSPPGFSNAYQPPRDQENECPFDSQNKVLCLQAPTTEPANSYSYEIGGGTLREVQDPCFTPKRSLKRSPPVSQTPSVLPSCSGSEQQSGIDKVPPPSRWEIPRTPVQAPSSDTPVQYQHYQLQSPFDKSTPRRVKTPTHPLSQSTRAKEHTPCRRLIKSTSSLESTLGLAEPLTLDSGPPQLPGLQYTANDLAYLQHVKMVKQVTELRTQADDLVRAQKRAQEEKEQLEYEAKKIDDDVATIKSKVETITADVHELVSGGSRTGDLQQSHMDQLKRLNQKTAAELERAERERRGKLAKVKETTEKLAKDIRNLELKQSSEKASLEAELASTQEELSSLDSKKQELCSDHQQANSELELLQAEMARVSLSEEDKLKEGESSKEQLEQSLRTLIRRCDLYVKRHNILKEMGL